MRFETVESSKILRADILSVRCESALDVLEYIIEGLSDELTTVKWGPFEPNILLADFSKKKSEILKEGDSSFAVQSRLETGSEVTILLKRNHNFMQLTFLCELEDIDFDLIVELIFKIAIQFKTSYGRICTQENLDYVNKIDQVDKDGHPVYEGNKGTGLAIRLQDELPGAYWINIFGSEYIDWFGKETFNSLNVIDEKWLDDDTIAIKLFEKPQAFSDKESIKTINDLKSTLGEDSFFDKNDPYRDTRSPFYDAEEEKQRKALLAKIKKQNAVGYR